MKSHIFFFFSQAICDIVGSIKYRELRNEKLSIHQNHLDKYQNNIDFEQKYAILISFTLEVLFMAIDYSNLWKLLIDKHMNKSQLREAAKISTNAIAKLGRNESVSLDTLEKICCALSCSIEDIMTFTSESSKGE